MSSGRYLVRQTFPESVSHRELGTPLERSNKDRTLIRSNSDSRRRDSRNLYWK